MFRKQNLCKKKDRRKEVFPCDGCCYDSSNGLAQ